jgi:uncharacterized lipoprotein YmbA
VLLAGCGTPPPPRLYSLVARPGVQIDRKLPLVAVRQVQIAKYLDRQQIVRRKTALEFGVSELELWAEGLDEMTTRVLIDDLSLRLPATQIAVADGALSPKAGTLLALEVDRFDPDPDGTAVLEARWTIRRDDEAGAVRSERITHPASHETAALVSAMSDCLGDLGDRLAAALSAG